MIRSSSNILVTRIFKLNRTSEALESWRKALALDPKNKNLANKIERTKAPSATDHQQRRIQPSDLGRSRNELSDYPTLWQRKMMWAALTAFCVVLLILIIGMVDLGERQYR